MSSAVCTLKNSYLLVFTICHARALPWAYGMSARYRGLIKKNIKKNYMEKDYCNLQCFEDKNYKDHFRKKQKKMKGKKNYIGKHCSIYSVL